MADATFSGNTAVTGAAVAIPDVMTAQVRRSTFTNSVATGNGGHKFTNSLREHNNAVQEYLKVMREKKSQTPPGE